MSPNTEFCSECGRPKPMIVVDPVRRRLVFDYIEREMNNGDLVDLLLTIHRQIRKNWFRE